MDFALWSSGAPGEGSRAEFIESLKAAREKRQKLRHNEETTKYENKCAVLDPKKPVSQEQLHEAIGAVLCLHELGKPAFDHVVKLCTVIILKEKQQGSKFKFMAVDSSGLAKEIRFVELCWLLFFEPPVSNKPHALLLIREVLELALPRCRLSPDVAVLASAVETLSKRMTTKKNADENRNLFRMLMSALLTYVQVDDVRWMGWFAALTMPLLGHLHEQEALHLQQDVLKPCLPHILRLVQVQIDIALKELRCHRDELVASKLRDLLDPLMPFMEPVSHQELPASEGNIYPTPDPLSGIRQLFPPNWDAHNFHKIDEQAKHADARSMSELINVTRHMDKVCAARFLFAWVASHVKYDIALKANKNAHADSAENAFATRKAICGGYANLYEKLCSLADIKCKVIPGWVKHGASHGWNIVEIDGKKHQIDCCWGAGSTSSNGNFEFKFNPWFFGPPATQLIYSHFPKDEEFQLLEPPVSWKQFGSLPHVRAMFWQHGFALDTHRAGRISLHEGQTFSLSFTVLEPSDVAMSAALARLPDTSEGSDTGTEELWVDSDEEGSGIFEREVGNLWGVSRGKPTLRLDALSRGKKILKFFSSKGDKCQELVAEYLIEVHPKKLENMNHDATEQHKLSTGALSEATSQQFLQQLGEFLKGCMLLWVGTGWVKSYLKGFTTCTERRH